jgi:predicted outer membrane repeat protein
VAGNASLATTISGSQFINNVAGTSGGAIGAASPAPFVVQDVTFVSNTAGIPGGGAISSGAALDVQGATFTGNVTAGSGGAIFAAGGTVALTNASFTGNNADALGGAILTTIPLTLSQVSFVSNTGRGGAGAIRSAGATTIADARFSKNTTLNGSGGAVLNSASLAITRTTFDGNQAARQAGDPQPSAAHGGALANEGAQEVIVSNSTFWENNAAGEGGAIYHRADSQIGRLINVTIARSGSSGIAGPLVISNSLLTGSSGPNCMGGVTTAGPNLEFPGTSCAASIQQADPLLDAGLKSNGGVIATVALKPGSPAIDVGDNSICAAPPISNRDQRQQRRPAGNACDLGAYELRP